MLDSGGGSVFLVAANTALSAEPSTTSEFGPVLLGLAYLCWRKTRWATGSAVGPTWRFGRVALHARC